MNRFKLEMCTSLQITNTILEIICIPGIRNLVTRGRLSAQSEQRNLRYHAEGIIRRPSALYCDEQAQCNAFGGWVQSTHETLIFDHAVPLCIHYS